MSTELEKAQDLINAAIDQRNQFANALLQGQAEISSLRRIIASQKAEIEELKGKSEFTSAGSENDSQAA